jgi:hypothetical protein
MNSDQPLLDQLEEGAIGGAAGGIAAKGLGAAGKLAGRTVDALGGRGQSYEEFIHKMITPALMGAFGAANFDPEHWQRDILGEIAGLATARGAGWVRQRTPSIAPTRPTQARGAGGRFAPGSGTEHRENMSQYQIDKFLYDRWQNIQGAGRVMGNTIAPALGALLGRNAVEEMK